MNDKLSKQERLTAMATATPEDGVQLLAGQAAEDAFALILEHPNPAAIVALLPVQEAYLMLHEIGAEDALALLELSTPEQVQGFIDIDCWDKDRLNQAKTRTWMMLLHELADEAFMHNLREMDLATLVVFFGEHMRVHKIENPDDDIAMDGPAFLTPDRRYLIEFTCRDEYVKMVNALLMRIYKQDFDFFYYLLEAVYWETGPEVEELAYRQRRERMDLRTIPDYYSALEIMTTVDLKTFTPPRKTAPAPLADEPGGRIGSEQFLTRYAHTDSLLRRLLAENFPERDGIALEVMGLANMAVVAHQVSFIDLEKVRQIVATTDGLLNIGLQYLAGDDLPTARQTMIYHRALDIHKIGRTLVVQLARRARSLPQRAAVDGKSPEQLLLDGPERDLALGLLLPHPVRLVEGQEEGWNELVQVRQAETQLDAVEALVDLMHDKLGFTPEFVSHLFLSRANIDQAAELSYRVLFNTFRCHDLLGRTPAPMPLTPADIAALNALLETVDGHPSLPAAKRAELEAWVREAVGERAELVVAILDRYQVGLARELADPGINPAFRKHVLVKLR